MSIPPIVAVNARPEFVLAAAGENHRERKDEAAQRVGIVEVRGFPADFVVHELRRDRVLEHAPGVEDAEGEIDAESGKGDDPPAIRHGGVR